MSDNFFPNLTGRKKRKRTKYFWAFFFLVFFFFPQENTPWYYQEDQPFDFNIKQNPWVKSKLWRSYLPRIWKNWCWGKSAVCIYLIFQTGTSWNHPIITITGCTTTSESSTGADTDVFGETEEIYAIKCKNSSALFLRFINKVASWELSHVDRSSTELSKTQI